ncbi:hypothetical protein EYF80_021211 [Liparis tanakae]|uniref:Uncharacterized protein n=1 Tax=Liparis tanakae TaxID=230148 RepID=A0A4Z2HTC4_9TELE|nr:hypothetical protein EYF80_021211 [Liparis tanakae]
MMRGDGTAHHRVRETESENKHPEVQPEESTDVLESVLKHGERSQVELKINVTRQEPDNRPEVVLQNVCEAIQHLAILRIQLQDQTEARPLQCVPACHGSCQQDECQTKLSVTSPPPPPHNLPLSVCLFPSDSTAGQSDKDKQEAAFCSSLISDRILSWSCRCLFGLQLEDGRRFF